ncbi:O-methyltransferase [Dongia sedimenti]|uniref:Class I SAM-dependent methyltransferase n=1 Tax=Dongia sedimenti TaxID=3064282 RepID=A0ABU0YJY5_9PROT|nr:class I SAM-dependent methyltransferase [Rhodospirillaceae bacterium R-7]
MARRSLELDDRLYDYLVQFGTRESDLLKDLRAETAKLPGAGMQIGPEQGAFMGLLVELIGAKRALEIGTFTGYSSLCIAGALPADGKLICCDVSEEYTKVARDYWRRAGLESKIELRLGPAVATLDALIDADVEPFDFAFIDADKTNYGNYYDRALKLVRPGGLIAIDNVLWGGDVAKPEENDADTQAIRALNEMVRNDERVTLALAPIGDGLTLARKR